MKSLLNRILSFSFILLISIMLCDNVFAKKIDTNNEQLKVYEVKQKEEVLVENNKIIDFYEETHEEIQVLIEEKKQEELRLEEERKLEEQRRIEEERRLEEQRRLEAERIKQQSYNVTESDSEIANFAMQFIGNPYVAGGTSLTSGADCSGFVQSVYANFGISLPRTAPDQSRVGYAVSIDDIKAGDIISYGYNGSVGHSAIYIGNGMIVHASTPALGIRTDSMYIMPIITIRRVI